MMAGGRRTRSERALRKCSLAFLCSLRIDRDLQELESGSVRGRNNSNSLPPLPGSRTMTLPAKTLAASNVALMVSVSGPNMVNNNPFRRFDIIFCLCGPSPSGARSTAASSFAKLRRSRAKSRIKLCRATGCVRIDLVKRGMMCKAKGTQAIEARDRVSA